ncbi:MAG TPA: NADH-quinone oxidoreductase subunit J [Candidatus Angelobacter sp.]|jgi:NADH-quinone oxidoreductase subunit J|nr:NADH-quinone oxidoreductase subunit J [Candidatus Angelobacter sp.]
MFHQILFIIFGAICIAGAINLLIQRHPINSALSLVVVMGSLALIYMLLGAEFVAAVQVIVYAGAIMVLFVFTIMLLNAGVEERTRGSRIALLLGGTGVVLLIGMIAAVIFTNDKLVGGVKIGNLIPYEKIDNTHTIAGLLFQKYLLPFEITSVLILIAIMGAVVLAARRR